MSYELRNVKKFFQLGATKIEALKQVQLKINPGEFIALQGPSGSGKSTLLNVLGLIEPPSDGEVIFDNKSLADCSESTLTDMRQEHIGFIFQNFNLIPILNALENVEYPLFLSKKFSSRKQIRERALKSLEEVGLSKFAMHKPSQLSGGQRQRVAIARALVKMPRLIIADEPTANLDSTTAFQILDLMKKLRITHNTSILVATHDSDIAEMAERRIRIKDGILT